MQRLKYALRLVGAWYRTPVGALYLLLLAAAGAIAALAGPAWALAVVLVVLAVFVPYKIYREGDVRSQQLSQAAAGATAGATAAAEQVAQRERKVALNAVETARGEWNAILAAERLSWSSAVQHVAGRLDEAGAGQSELRSALDRLSASVGSRLSELESRAAALAATQDEALTAAAAARDGATEQRAAVDERIDDLGRQMRAMVASERSRRSLALARRDAPGYTCSGVIAMITPQRSGSTWLFDMLRCHPDVTMAPTGELFRALGGAGRRYPADLSDTRDASLDIETAEGVGAAIPAYTPPPRFANRQGVRTFAIEKLHPMVLGFDSAGFADRLSAVAAGLPNGVQPLYLVREPAASLRSFLAYQQRSPRWHPDLPPPAVLDMYVRSFEMIAELAVKRPGIVVTYEQLARPVALLARLYRFVSPDLDGEAAAELAVHAVDSTRRDERNRGQPATFFTAAAEGVPSEMELMLGSHADDADLARRAFDRCRELYREIAEVAERQVDESLPG